MIWHLVAAFWETVARRLRRGPLRPTWSFTFEFIVRFVRRDWEASSERPLPEVRATLEGRFYPQGVVKKCVTRDQAVGGVPARWFVPPGANDDVVILYFHGGSYIYGSARTTHAELCARIALGAGITVVGLDYRLAPEHPFPAAHDDAKRALEALSDKRVILAGDSAGANLAIELQIVRRDAGQSIPPAALISPWTDLTMPGASYVTNDAFEIGTRATLAKHAEAYANGTPLDDPRISPVYADLRGLPATLVIAGDAEALYDDIGVFTDQLREQGVEVTLHVAKDMPHDAPLFAAFHPNAEAAVEAIATFVRAQSSSSSSPATQAR